MNIFEGGQINKCIILTIDLEKRILISKRIVQIKSIPSQPTFL